MFIPGCLLTNEIKTMKTSGIYYLFSLLIVLAAFTSCAPGNGQKKNNLVMEKGTFKYDLDFLTKGKITGITDPRILAAILLSIMVVLYVIFN